MKNLLLPSSILVVVVVAAACGGDDAQTKSQTPAGAENAAAADAQKKPPTAEEAAAFAARVNTDLKAVWTRASRASWVSNTYITDDTEKIASEADEAVMAYISGAVKDSRAFDDVAGVDDVTRRQLKLLRLAASLPAPDDPAKRSELAQIAAKMQSTYGKGKWCPPGEPETSEKCEDIVKLSEKIQKGTTYDDLTTAWTRWHGISPPIRDHYKRYVELANEGAKAIGFDDVATMWKSRYDMTPAELETTVEALWQQVKPLYDQLHCVTRDALAKKYPGKFDPAGAIPAHLMGNMWAQEWGTLYPLLEPHKVKQSLDVTKALEKKKYDALKMVQLGEAFFTSLGLEKLPPSFYERSMITKPRDREVVCHASAWDLTYEKDVRIKMCTQVNEEDLITIHHELGHIYYYMYYFDKPVLFQDGAHDGFHEAIGDALALSVTPGYLKKVGILDTVVDSPEAVLNFQMKVALDKISFLPFGRLMDQWRWDVFSGKVPAEKYNEHWWKLRRDYQGVMPPVERTEADFDAGAKYHIPANVPYLRYFLSFIVQFQFHKAMCAAAGHTGPLHTCSIHGSTAAGDKLKAMLQLGSSKPWAEALQAMTGTDKMDAAPFLEYFAPLSEYLKTKTTNMKCGW